MRMPYKCLLAAVFSVGSAAVFAADLNHVRVVFDPDFTNRTNMGRPAGETSDVMVAVDVGLMARTGVTRDAKDAGPVTVARDHDYMSRTNMGGTAMRQNETTALKQ